MLNRSEILCPVTAQVCPTLKQLHTLYVENETSVNPEVALQDRHMYEPLRSRHVGEAIMNQCNGVTEAGACAAHEGHPEPEKGKVGRAVRAFFGQKVTS